MCIHSFWDDILFGVAFQSSYPYDFGSNFQNFCTHKTDKSQLDLRRHMKPTKDEAIKMDNKYREFDLNISFER